MLELATVQIGKFVEKKNEKRKSLIKKLAHQTCSSNGCSQKQCSEYVYSFCHYKTNSQKRVCSLDVARKFSVQVAHEGASFVNRVGTLELKNGWRIGHPSCNYR